MQRKTWLKIQNAIKQKLYKWTEKGKQTFNQNKIQKWATYHASNAKFKIIEQKLFLRYLLLKNIYILLGLSILDIFDQ